MLIQYFTEIRHSAFGLALRNYPVQLQIRLLPREVPVFRHIGSTPSFSTAFHPVAPGGTPPRRFWCLTTINPPPRHASVWPWCGEAPRDVIMGTPGNVSGGSVSLSAATEFVKRPGRTMKRLRLFFGYTHNQKSAIMGLKYWGHFFRCGKSRL